MTGRSQDPAREDGAGRCERLVVRIYASLLRLLPIRFRRAHGAEMRNLVRHRLRERRCAAGSVSALGHGLAEMADLVRIAALLRARELAARWRSRKPSATVGGRDRRLAAVSILAAALLIIVPDIRIEGPEAARSSGLAARADSVDFRARDPAGEFTLSIRRGIVVAATVDGHSLPEGRIVQAADSIRLLAPGGDLVVGVHFDPGKGRIGWEARPGSLEVECDESSGPMTRGLGRGRS